jgi:hypothetical protein
MATSSESNAPSTMERVVAAYTEGASDVEIARILGLTKRAFYELCESNDGFAAIVEKGRTLAEAWWYEQGRKGLTREKFNSPLFMANMKNRYGWADKIDTGTKDSSEPLNQDQAVAELRSTLARIGKKQPDLLRILEGGPDAQ